VQQNWSRIILMEPGKAAPASTAALASTFIFIIIGIGVLIKFALQ
jgi:hypothetical protein